MGPDAGMIAVDRAASPSSRQTKVLELEALAERLALLRAEGKKVVLCHGVFDLLHIGHIRYFEQAKRQGDVLVVTVTPDRFVNKGPHRPVFSEQLRCEAVAALQVVDWVAVNQWPMAVKTIQLLRPDAYVKGPDYREAKQDVTGGIALEEAAVRSVGGRIVFTDDITFSATQILNRSMPAFPKPVMDYLAGFASRYSADDITGYLERARTLKALVVGEAIVDDYHYCEQVGKSAKEPVLVARYLSSEQFAGGSLAIANHLANFCDQVGVFTCLGKTRSYEHFIRRKLQPNVTPHFLYRAKASTIVKRRFMEQYLSQKLFELYEMSEDGDPGYEERLCEQLREVVPAYDLVLVADYGHGMMTSDAVNVLCDRAKYLAVNTQANAGNRGLHTVSKYRRADFISLARHELVLEERNRRQEIQEMMLSVSKKLSCPRVLITCGKDGNVAYSQDEGFVQVPAFATQVVDRMGAGDAVMSLASLCAVQQAPMEIVGFIGNVVGAEAVATMGHRSSIERAPLLKHIGSLLK